MMQTARMGDLHEKEVICMRDGYKLGFVDDLELDIDAATVRALVIYGKAKLFGLLGREDDTVVPWQAIEVIGEDAVLVDFPSPDRPPRRRGLFFGGR